MYKFLTIDENADSAFGLSSVANFDNQVTKVFLRWRLLCKHNKTKITLSTRPIPVAYAWTLCANIWTSTKPEAHYALHFHDFHQRRTDPRPQTTCKKLVVCVCGFWDMWREKKQTYRHADRNTLHLSGPTCIRTFRIMRVTYAVTSLCWASTCRRDTAEHNLLLAAVRRAAAPLLLGATVDRYLPPARCSAANPPQRYAAGEWCDRRTDRQTDLWTPDRFIDPAPHTTPALRPISKKSITVCNTNNHTMENFTRCL